MQEHEVATEEELREALVVEFKLEDPQCIGTIRMRKTYGLTQTGSFKVPVTVANKMTEKGKVKVGWSVCQLRVPQRLLKCYKCLGFNHIATNCRSSIDRRSACWKCGKEGYKSGGCTNLAQCSLCPTNDNEHQTGGIKCKAYQEAMQKVTQIILNHCDNAQDLLMQNNAETYTDVAIIAEPYLVPSINGNWVANKANMAAIWVCGKDPIQEVTCDNMEGFVVAKINGIYFCSCYAPPRWTIGEYEGMLDNLTSVAEQETGSHSLLPSK